MNVFRASLVRDADARVRLEDAEEEQNNLITHSKSRGGRSAFIRELLSSDE